MRVGNGNAVLDKRQRSRRNLNRYLEERVATGLVVALLITMNLDEMYQTTWSVPSPWPILCVENHKGSMHLVSYRIFEAMENNLPPMTNMPDTEIPFGCSDDVYCGG